MACITVPLPEEMKKRLDSFAWVNWSEIGREEVLKRDIFDKYVKTRKISAEDTEFCDRIDWHPVDELPVKKEFADAVSKTERGGHKKSSLEDLDHIMGLK
jgi:hypothetical protein